MALLDCVLQSSADLGIVSIPSAIKRWNKYSKHYPYYNSETYLHSSGKQRTKFPQATHAAERKVNIILYMQAC